MTDETFSSEGQIPSAPNSALARQALKRATLSVGSTLMGVYGLGAVLTYSPEDPSLNVASDGQAHNLFGGPGAAFADLAVQALGAASPLAMAALIAAGGLRIWRQRMTARIDKPRLLAGVAGVVLLAGAASCIPTNEGWPLATGFGGGVGDAAANLLSGLASLPGLPFPRAAAGFLAALGGLFSVGWAFQLKPRDVRAAADAASRAAAATAGGASRALTYVSDRVKREDPGAWNDGQRRLAEQPRRQPRTLPSSIEPLEPDAPAMRTDGRGETREEAPSPRRFAPPRAPAQRAASSKQSSTAYVGGGARFELPSENLFTLPKQRTSHADPAQLQSMSRQLEAVLQDFGVQGEIVSARPGPVVTLFELEPAPGVKSSRVVGLADDIARSMSATAARVAVIPGRNAIGIELPNPKRETVFLRTLLSSPSFAGVQGGLPLALGETIEGDPFAADLSKMPHLLIAGTTGSGKSVGINAMILSLIYRHPPEECRFIMIDPKMLELSVYEGIPHLLSPVVTDPKKAVVALKWTVREMEERYRRMSKLGVRNITGYNDRMRDALARGETLTRTVQVGYDEDTGAPINETQELPLEPMPYIVVVIDEMADLMIVAGKEIEAAVQRLAQMARAAGIHLIMATQRPSVDVITGTIKANFPTRISYQVTSKIDSRTILGEQGAEQLLGQGDLLYMAGGGRIRRLHGPFVTDAEVERVVAMLKAQGAPSYRNDITEEEPEYDPDAEPDLFDSANASGDELFDRAVEIIARDRKASTSYLQRRLSIGYNRAATLMERLEKEGVISMANAAGKREILIGAGGEI
ncbi:MAG: DNA translocase FtsK 4TM domain-containing protein [Hyphomonadaceae bacterium]|nr:DNA translocase FtsK 4TM domain-containing protein [Hyphomonadaceae bacterium]